LGITEQGFEVVQHIFDYTKYKGVFNDESNERWWKSLLLTTLSDHIQEPGLPWVLGRKLPGIKDTHYSKCYASGEDYPDTVAFEDSTDDAKRAAMKLKYTIPHPNFEDLLFFEELRMMQPAE